MDVREHEIRKRDLVFGVLLLMEMEMETDTETDMEREIEIEMAKEWKVEILGLKLHALILILAGFQRSHLG